MPEINNNPSIIYPIVPAPAPVPVIYPVQQPAQRPEPEMADEDINDGEDDMDLGTDAPRPPRAKVDDGISDLFAAPDIDAEIEDVDELFDVTEEDIMGDEDGDLSDLTEVSREDIMGRSPKPRARRMSRPSRENDGGMQGVGY